MKVLGLICVFALAVSAAFGEVVVSDPFALEGQQYTELIAESGAMFGASVDVCENFAIVGMHTAHSGYGGCAIYRKTPALTWTVLTNFYSTEYAELGSSVAIDGTHAFVGGPDRLVDGKTVAGMVQTFRKQDSGIWLPEQQLKSPNPTKDGFFGRDVAVDGSRAAVGAYGEDGGRVYMFSYTNGWTYESTLMSPSPAIGESFGVAVALAGDCLAVGASGTTVDGKGSAGSVYVYKRNSESGTWEHKATLTGDESSGAWFGATLDLDINGTLIVGAYAQDSDAGAAFIYDVSGSEFTLESKLLKSVSQTGEEFGFSVAVDGNLAVVGAPRNSSTNLGQAVVFQKTNGSWKEMRNLDTYDLDASAYFGYSASVSRNVIWVGAAGAAVRGHSFAGLVTGYEVAQTTHRSGLMQNSGLGSSLAMTAQRIVVGAPYEDVGTKSAAGRVELLRRRGSKWEFEGRFGSMDQGADHYFGQAVAAKSNRLLIGAPGVDDTSTDVGRIYLFEQRDSEWFLPLTVVGPEANAMLGSAVALNDEVAAVQCARSSQGDHVVHIYRCNGSSWSLHETITQPAGYSGNIEFGCSLAFNGDDTLVIGAYMGDKAFLYDWTGSAWSHTATMDPSPYAGLFFGRSVDICDDYIVVGAASFSTSRGLVYMYKRNGDSVSLSETIQNPFPVDGDNFGLSVAFGNNGRSLVVGAHGRDSSLRINDGAAYVFRLSDEQGVGWYLDATITNPDDGNSQDSDHFGRAVAAFGETVAVGAPRNDTSSLDSCGSVTVFESVPRVAPADFDGDGITDIGCYYPPLGWWYVYQSGDGEFWTTQFGYADTTPFVDDFDGDWKADFGCYDGDTGNWFGYDSENGFWVERAGGNSLPKAVGDFDGDRCADYAVFDTATAGWTIYQSAKGIKTDTYGSEGGVPVAGDFDGDGVCDYGTYRASDGLWRIRQSRDGDWSTKFGYAGTTPITGDFDADGKQDFGCYYPPTGGWYIYKSASGLWVNNFGYEGTVPVTGDFDGDGVDDFGCYYAPQGTWYVYKSRDGFWVNNFGYEGTVPMN